MDDNFYKKLIQDSPTGYAYHKIICNEKGVPCDYEFLEVNAAFERLTGLKGSAIIGRKITKVLPNILKDEFDWISFYGNIAINGEKKEFEQFSEPLQRWYKIEAYSPKKYYFVTNFVDITKEINQLAEMERLIEMSEELLQIGEQKIGYKKISEDFLKISGAKYAAFNLFDEDGKSFSTVSITGDKGILNIASAIIGFRIEKKKWSFDPVLAEKIKAKTITRFPHLLELVGNAIPVSICVLLEKTLKIGEIVLIRIMKKDTMLGHFILLMEKGKNFDKDSLAEVFTRQLGMLITRKRAEEELLKEKTLTDAIFHSIPGMIYLYNDQGDLVRWNKKHQDITGYSSEELSKMNLLDWYKGDEKSRSAVLAGITRATEEGFGDAEADLQKKDGTKIPMYFTASSLYLGGKQFFAGIAIDIAERKKKEAEIFYLSYHDQLTGLYNRRFYEEELKKLDSKINLPLTIVMGDVNGLKLINDSFGHIMGDNLLIKVAKVLQAGCREEDIIARLAGDEFVIVLTKTDTFETEQIIKRITELALNEKVGSMNVSISFGYETKNNEEEEIEEIFKNAEDHMYKKKLMESPGIRGKTIKNMIGRLYEKSKREEQHSYRVSELCKSMGEALGMTKYENEELESAGLLHDIGKIAIDENLLNNYGKLTIQDQEEVNRHAEIGYRMLNTVTNMSQMANYVLYHHERWDGRGYPKGLKGDEIPFASRIIAIADAYDEMTSGNSIINPLTKESAIDLLQKNKGIEFDPNLVNVFIEKVLIKN